MRAVPDLGVIDLIGDEPQVMSNTGLRNNLPCGAVIDHPGRIVGRIDQQRPRPLCCGLQIGGAWLKIMGRIA